MALSDKQRIAIVAAAIRDHQNGTSRSFPDLIRSPEDIERLLANMGLPLAALYEAGQRAAQRISALGADATPEMRRAIVEDVHALAVRDGKPERP